MMTDNRARRSGRITLAVPILLIGSDSEGKVFSEQTRGLVFPTFARVSSGESLSF